MADVVIDAIMVSCARFDPVNGSSNMQSLHVISVCVGGVVGSIVASVTNDRFHPYVVFNGYAILVLLITALGRFNIDFTQLLAFLTVFITIWFSVLGT